MVYNLESETKPLPPNTHDTSKPNRSSTSFNIDKKLNRQLEQELEFLEEFVNPKTTNPYVIVGIVWLIGFMLSFILEFVLKL